MKNVNFLVCEVLFSEIIVFIIFIVAVAFIIITTTTTKQAACLHSVVAVPFPLPSLRSEVSKFISVFNYSKQYGRTGKRKCKSKCS